MKAKKPKAEKPRAEMTDAERLQDWRSQRKTRGPIEKPSKGKRTK